MAVAQEARAVLRLIDRERRLNAKLTEVREHLRPHARRLCDAAGFPVLLSGPALERLAIERRGPVKVPAHG